MLFDDPAMTTREDESLVRAIAEEVNDENVSREEILIYYQNNPKKL